MNAIQMSKSLLSNQIQIIGVDEKATNAPVAISPSEFPKELFENAINVHPLMQHVYNSHCSSKSYILKHLMNNAKNDEFVQNLLKILKNKENPDRIIFNISRSDYMVSNPGIKQIEFNTISVSFLGLSSKIKQFYSEVCPPSISCKIPENENLVIEAAKAFVEAFNAYGVKE